MLLQYLVSPAMVYLIAAIAIHSMLPDVPILALCFGFLIIVAIVSLIGMKTAMVVNKVALVAQLVDSRACSSCAAWCSSCSIPRARISRRPTCSTPPSSSSAAPCPLCRWP